MLVKLKTQIMKVEAFKGHDCKLNALARLLKHKAMEITCGMKSN